MNFITYLEPPYLLELQLHSSSTSNRFFFVSAYLNGEGVQEFFTFQNSFKKIITMAKVFTPPLDIQRLKLVETVATNARFRNTCKFKVFFTIVGSTHPQA